MLKIGLLGENISQISMISKQVSRYNIVSFVTQDFLNMEFAFEYGMWELLKHEYRIYSAIRQGFPSLE